MLYAHQVVLDAHHLCPHSPHVQRLMLYALALMLLCMFGSVTFSVWWGAACVAVASCLNIQPEALGPQ